MDDKRDRDARAVPATHGPGTGWATPSVRGARGGAATRGGGAHTGGVPREAQVLLDAGMPFHAHEVFEDAWKSGPAAERALWRALAQLAVGLTHAARGNSVGGARLLLRGAAGLAAYGETGPHGIDITGLTTWAHRLADGLAGPVDAKASAPQLTGG